MDILATYINIEAMHFYAKHGVLEQERLTGGDYVVSLRVGAQLDKAVQSDNVSDTVNYATLYDIVKTEMQQPSNLIEHVAGRIAKSIYRVFPQVETIDITVTKTNPPMGGDTSGASVELYTKR